MKVSIIIPCFNENGTIAKIIAAVRSVPVEDMEIIFHPVNQGKGAALRSGFAAATGDVVLVQDADLEYNPDEYPVLLEPIFSGKADGVFARVSWAVARIASFISGTWWATNFLPCSQTCAQT
jgi:glycosyltransferase involved in cell wall biosynthesis